MLRTLASTLAWVGRIASMVFGLALVLALMFGVATTAFGADGDFFKVGRSNLASAVSTLTNSEAGPPLSLKVDRGAPVAVNSGSRVTKLNADKVDGHDAPLWAVIRADGLADSGYGMTGSEKVAAGQYVITFNRDICQCAYAATIATTVFLGQTGGISTYHAGPKSVGLFISNSAGTFEDRPFHLVVNC